MSYYSFILLNAIFFLRPYDLVPEWELAEARLYLWAMALCLLTTLPRIVEQFSLDSLARRPITVCIIGVMIFIVVSKVAQRQFDVFDDFLPEFVKIFVHFLLLMAVIDTPKRLLNFMGWLIAFTIALAVLGALNYHEILTFECMTPVMQEEYDQESGQSIMTPRMCSMGVYHDPNDFCLILTTAAICCRCRAAFASSYAVSLLWNAPIILFCYAMALTKSRGGLLGFMVGLVAIFYARFGWKRCLPLTAVLVPAMLAGFAGRQTNFNATGDDTAQQRIGLWADGFMAMQATPLTFLTGIGADNYADACSQVAHNSFVHTYVELGLLGGSCFVGAFYLAVWGPRRARLEGALDAQPDLLKLQPFIFALVTAYAAGVYSLSRSYGVPTYLTVGWGGAFMAMAYANPPHWWRWNNQMVKRICKVGITALLFLKAFTRVMIQR